MTGRPAPVEISVEVEDAGWTALLPEAAALADEAARAALAADARAAAGEVVVLLTNDAEVRALNARFRGKDAATNVLSFPAGPLAPGALGDIALALGVCAREAKAQGKSLAHHLQHLVAHGVLHLLGYDHQDEAEAETMEAKERAIMAELGAPDPYLTREDLGARHGD
ncbi:MAG: rRNA maturation RNase YbeY [Caulobacteraceae bacterium]|nr:rRNA maturation RNase YbeY [Caulobacteraceae bacterium]